MLSKIKQNSINTSTSIALYKKIGCSVFSFSEISWRQGFCDSGQETENRKDIFKPVKKILKEILLPFIHGDLKNNLFSHL